MRIKNTPFVASLPPQDLKAIEDSEARLIKAREELEKAHINYNSVYGSVERSLASEGFKKAQQNLSLGHTAQYYYSVISQDKKFLVFLLNEDAH